MSITGSAQRASLPQRGNPAARQCSLAMVDGAILLLEQAIQHSAVRFGKIRDYTIHRLAIFIGKRHKRGRRFGLNVVAYLSPNQCGLINLTGIVVPPRANKPWREKPNAGGERRR
jgi:hypothetical protein